MTPRGARPRGRRRRAVLRQRSPPRAGRRVLLPGRRPLDGPSLPSLVVLGSGGHTAEMFAILRALDPRRYAPRAVRRRRHRPHERLQGGAPRGFRRRRPRRLGRHRRRARAMDLPRRRSPAQIPRGGPVLPPLRLHHTPRHPRRVRARLPRASARRPVQRPGHVSPSASPRSSPSASSNRRTSPPSSSSSRAARVQSLSLTGKLLYHLRLADEVFVQWETLAERYPRTTLAGRVV